MGGWLAAAQPATAIRPPGLRALISPHAGLSYSGATAAYAYANINLEGLRRIVVLGPAHHHYIAGIAVTPFTRWATPLGALEVDTAAVQALRSASTPEAPVGVMPPKEDEAEHSLELQTPFLAHLLRAPGGQSSLRTDVRLVPIVVGALTDRQEELYGRLMAPYLSDPATLVCISSDFCHWGTRFRFTPVDPAHGAIHRSIEAMDRQGMDCIAAQDCEGWRKYLQTTHNTICGRAPISILLCALAALDRPHRVEWLRYAQSQAALTKADSSVSYAAAAVVLA